MNAWPFTNYASQIDWSDLTRKANEARKRSERRQSQLDSPDPAIRAQAAGNLGPLSGVKKNQKLAKNSRLG